MGFKLVACRALTVDARRDMSPADAIIFLRRKHDLIVRCTCDHDERAALDQTWERIFANLAPGEKLPTLQKLDRALEKAIRRHVFDWDCDPLRRKLVEEFGLSGLTSDEIEMATVPALAPDDVRLAPSSSRRPVSRRFRDFQGVERACIDTSAASIEELAQLYADYTEKPVRLSAVLAGRRIPAELRPQMCEADETEVVAALWCYFELVHVLVLRDQTGIVLKDTSARAVALAAARQPKPATPEQIQRAAAAMSLERFWQMVEVSRQKSGDGMADPERLQSALARCSIAEILGFQLRLEECLVASYRLDLWAVA